MCHPTFNHFSFLSFMKVFSNMLLIFINLVLGKLDDVYETLGNVVLHCTVYEITREELEGIEKGFYLLPEVKQNKRRWFCIEEKYILKKDSHIKRRSIKYKNTYWKVKKDTEVELVSGFFGSVDYEDKLTEISESKDLNSEDFNNSEEVKKKPSESDIDVRNILVCKTIGNTCLREVIQTNSIEFDNEKWKFDRLSILTIFYRTDNSFSKGDSCSYELFSEYSSQDIIFIQKNKIADIMAGKRVEYEIPLKNKKVIRDVHEKDLTNVTDGIRINSNKTPLFIIYAYLITISLIFTGVLSFCFCIYIVKALFNYYHKNETSTV